MAYNFRHIPPKQLSPAEQKLPQRPQFVESLIKLALFTQRPMQRSYPAAQLQEPAVQLSPMPHWLPHRPQFRSSFVNRTVSVQLPWHHCCPAEQLAGPPGNGLLAGGVGLGWFLGL